MTRKNCWRCPLYATFATPVETTFKASDHPESYVMICRTNTEAAEFIRALVRQGKDIPGGATHHDEYSQDGVFAFFPNDGMFSIYDNLNMIKECWGSLPIYYWEDFKSNGQYPPDIVIEGTRCVTRDRECYMEANPFDGMEHLRTFIRCERLKEKARKRAAGK